MGLLRIFVKRPVLTTMLLMAFIVLGIFWKKTTAIGAAAGLTAGFGFTFIYVLTTVRLFGDAPRRRTANHDAATGQFVDDLASAELPSCLPAAHGTACSVAGGAEGLALALRCAGEDVGGGAHGASDQYRLAGVTIIPGKIRVPRLQRPRGPLAVNEQLLHLTVHLGLDAVDADVNHDRARLDPVPGHHLRPAHRGHHDIPFYTLQRRTVLKPCGALDAEDVRRTAVQVDAVVGAHATDHVSERRERPPILTGKRHVVEAGAAIS